MPHTSRPSFSRLHPLHVTLRVRPDLPSLRSVHLVRSPREVRNALAYVLLNARKHAAARGREVLKRVTSVDPASSGRWFKDWARALPPAPDEPAVAAPQTWLLRVGWRRHGLTDPSEILRARRR